ncbi:Hint domain-containing protein [Acinetobacter venetianus]
MNGFAAGTLVHTDKGLVPIQDIKVGDLVLSMSEENVGEKAYKPVLRIIETSNQEVYRFAYCTEDQFSEMYMNLNYVFLTVKHPIWSIEENRWRPVDEFQGYSQVYTLGMDEKQYHFFWVNQLYRTYDSQGNIYGHTAPPLFRDFAEADRIEAFFKVTFESIKIYNMEYENIYSPFIDEEISSELIKDLSLVADGTPLLVNTYHIEVEDFKTYFVGELGLWVHQ